MKGCIFFICEDALVIYHDAISKGVAVSKPFVGNNRWDTGKTDPDGYQVYFESATDVPGRTEYFQQESPDL